MLLHTVQAKMAFTSRLRCRFSINSCLYCFFLFEATVLCDGFSRQDLDCSGSLCYKLMPQRTNQSAAHVLCDLQGAALVNLTLDSEWNNTRAFSDALKLKDGPAYSLMLWTNLVFKRAGNTSELSTTAGESVKCASAACRALLQSVEANGTWCAVFSVGNTSMTNKWFLEDCAAENAVVCEKGMVADQAEDITILGLSPELFAAIMIVVYILLVSAIAVYWGTITDQKKARDYEEMRGVQAEMFRRFPRLDKGDRGGETEKRRVDDETASVA